MVSQVERIGFPLLEMSALRGRGFERDHFVRRNFVQDFDQSLKFGKHLLVVKVEVRGY